MKTILIASVLWVFGFIQNSNTSFDVKNGGSCAVPAGLTTTNQTGSSAVLGWGAVPGSAGYNIEVENASGNANFFKISTSVNATTFTIDGLLPTLPYKFKVRTYCLGGGKSDWSGWYFFNAGASSGNGGNGSCGTPGGQQTTNITNNSAKLKWNAVSGVSGYRINIENASGNNSPMNLTINLPSGTTNYTVPGLLPGKAYKWKVRSLCGSQTSDWSPKQTFVTMP